MELGSFLDGIYYPYFTDLDFSFLSFDEILDRYADIQYELDRNEQRMDVKVHQLQGTLHELIETYMQYYFKKFDPLKKKASVFIETRGPCVFGFCFEADRLRINYEHSGLENVGNIIFSYTKANQINDYRYLQAAKEESRWVWDEFPKGTNVFDFEDTAAYTKKNIRERLTIGMIDRYAKALGVDAYNEDFYGPRCLIIDYLPNEPLRSREKILDFDDTKRLNLGIKHYPEIPTPRLVVAATMAEIVSRVRESDRKAAELAPKTNEIEGDVTIDRKSRRYIGTGYMRMENIVAIARMVGDSDYTYIDLGSTGARYEDYLVALGEESRRRLALLDSIDFNSNVLAVREMLEFCASVGDEYMFASAYPVDLEGAFTHTLWEHEIKLVKESIYDIYRHANPESAIRVAWYDLEEQSEERLPERAPPRPAILDSPTRTIKDCIPCYTIFSSGEPVETACLYAAIRYHQPLSVIIIERKQA